MSEGTTDADAFETLYRDLPSQLFTLEESIHQAARTLKTFEPGEAIVAFGSMSAKIRVPLLPSANLSKEEAAALRRRFIDASPSSMPIEEAKTALAARKAQIIAAAKQHAAPPPEPDLKAPREPLPAVKELRDILADISAVTPDPEPEPPKPTKPKPKRPPKGPFKPRIVGGNPDIPLPPKNSGPKPL